jgi:hypothetical protein
MPHNFAFKGEDGALTSKEVYSTFTPREYENGAVENIWT